MQVEQLRNYGKDILTIQREGRTPLRKKVRLIGPVLAFAGRLMLSLGPAGVPDLFRRFKREVQRAEQLDWSSLRQRGISEQNLQFVIRKIVFAKVLADLLGLERAAQLRNRLSERIACDVLEEVFAPAESIAACGEGDCLFSFKQYYLALCAAMAKAGLEEGQLAEDTEDTFQLNITYCAWCEVARALGDPYLCYYSSCYGDEVFFPKFCERLGLEFSRSGTLGTGMPVCDMRFVRKGADLKPDGRRE